MLEIKLSNNTTCTPIRCSLHEVEDHVRVQRDICDISGKFLIEPLRVISFTYTFK